MYILVFIAGYLANLFLFRTKHLHSHWSEDNQSGYQKIHTEPALRIGGVGVLVALFFSTFLNLPGHDMLIIAIISGLPVFLAGLGEDITKNIPPKLRLAFAFSSAAIFVFWTGYYAQTINTPGIRLLFLWYPAAFLITTIAIAGVANAVNIIDGANGLASGSLMIMFGTLAFLTHQTYDLALSSYALVHVAAIAGFFLWNFPRARLFLGDGGAYYLGYALAIGLIMAFERNFAISPWTSLLIVIYPVTETVFSIYRRIVRAGVTPQDADNIHLHHLVRRFVAKPLSKRLGWNGKGVNSLTGALMLTFPLTSCAMAIIGFYTTPLLSMAFVLIIFTSYVLIYFRLSRLYMRGGKLLSKAK